MWFLASLCACITHTILVEAVNTRLIPGPYKGRVEVFYHGSWGTVCDDYFDVRDARVVCRSVGQPSLNAEVVKSAGLGRGSGEIHLDDLACTGFEVNLAYCYHRGWGNENCVHSEDVGVICQEVRLVPGPLFGRVEVYRNGEWGTVCDDDFELVDAIEVCRTLGLKTDHATISKFGSGSGKIWMDNLNCTGTESSIYKCSHRGWGSHNCGHSEDVGVICHNGRAVRLVPGPTRGRVEINYLGEWGTVCDDLFSNVDATVVCRALGFSPGNASSIQRYGGGTGNIVLDSVACTGKEVVLDHCKHNGWRKHDCSHSEDVGVSCIRDLPVRLVPGPTGGRLEVNVSGVWETVCDDDFTYDDAKVVCRSLGLQTDFAEITKTEFVSGRIWLGNINCTGNESSLGFCDHHWLGVHKCEANEDVWVTCHSYPPTRLVPGPRAGRVEVYRRGEWGTVCDNKFTYIDAQVVCRSLGMKSYNGEVAPRGKFAHGSGTIYLDTVGCNGYESSLNSCSHSKWGITNCTHLNDVGVICHLNPTRLVPGPRAGRVEVYREGKWGTVCDKKFTYNDAMVVCRSLGIKSYFAEVAQRGKFAHGSGTIYLDTVGCNGYESSLNSCSHSKWGITNCTHLNDVGVICHLNPTRLVPGPRAGRVEVYREGKWGTVCDKKFTYNDAMVVCRSLGIKSYFAEVAQRGKFAHGSGTIYLDTVGCNGYESSLNSCSHSKWGITNCTHLNDVGVICHLNPTRLVPGPRAGRVEVYREGKWGTVCDKKFTYNDAMVVCRSLGIKSYFAEVAPRGKFAHGSGTIYLDTVGCNGYESSLNSCSHSKWGITNCTHLNDVGVICHLNAPTRLVPGPEAGRVEVYRRGSWGTVCMDNFTDTEAQVVCRSLGFNSEGIKYRTTYMGLDQAWFRNISCAGNESSLFHCRNQDLHPFNCRSYYVWIMCHKDPIRLVPGPRAGRVEVYSGVEWGTVCDKNFTYDDARMVCRSLGFYDYFAEVAPRGKFPHGSGTISLDTVGCNGYESSLSSCSHSKWGITNCSHFDDVGVICHLDAPTRLVPGPRAGRLEVYWIGKWGTVCIDNFTDTEAQLVCRSLGFNSESIKYYSTDEGPEQTLLRKFACDGYESSLFHCQTDFHPTEDCSSRHVWIMCHKVAFDLPQLRVYPQSEVNVNCTEEQSFDIIWTLGEVVIGNTSSLSRAFSEEENGEMLECQVFKNGQQIDTSHTIVLVFFPPPLITVDIYDTFIGSNITIGSSRHCNPPPDTYSLIAKNNGSFLIRNSSVPPVLYNLTVSDSGQYLLFLRNWMNVTHGLPEFGHGARLIKLSILYEPNITCEDEYTVVRNTSLILVCFVDARPLPNNVTWVHEYSLKGGNNQTLSTSTSTSNNGSQRFVHLIERVQESDSGSYLCQANNTMQSSEGSEVVGTGTCRMKVTVLVPPEPEMSGTLSCLEGNNVELSLPVASVPPPHLYRWRKAGDETDYLQTSSPPFISNINRSFSGDYIVKVYNVLESTNDGTRYGEGLQFIRLHVQYEPNITCEDEYTVVRNTSLILVCFVDARPLPNNVTWVHEFSLKGGNNQTLSTSTSTSNNGSQRFVHLIERVQESDSGSYLCQANNTMQSSEGSEVVGTGTCRMKVTVLVPPEPEMSGTLSCLEGNNVGLILPVASVPPPHLYRWRKAGDETDYLQTSSPPFISNINRSFSGDYIVKVYNVLESTNDGTRYGEGLQFIRLHVQYEPNITCEDEYTVVRNTSLILVCFVDARPLPNNVTWVHEFSLKGGNNQTLSTSTSTSNNGSQRFVHLIERVQESDSGSYLCQANNTMQSSEGSEVVGTGTCRMKVTVLVPPEPEMSGTLSCLEGNNVGLSLPVASVPPPHLYRWRKAGDETDYLQTSSPPFISNINRSFSGDYIVKVYNVLESTNDGTRYGEGLQFIRLHVQYEPNISCEDEYTVVRNTSLILVCFVDARPLPNNVTWVHEFSLKGGNNQTLSTSTSTSNNGSQRFVHLIERVQESDSGSYLCQANNTMQSSEGSEVVGTGTCRMKVTVLVPPEPEMSGTLSCLEGNNVGLSLPVASVPPPHLYRWRKAGDETDYLQTSSPPFISNINRSFSGDYIVKVYNVLESTNDGTRYGEGLQFIRLHVQYEPNISCEDEYTVVRNTSLILVCFVDARPLPNNVTWVHEFSLKGGNNQTLSTSTSTSNNGSQRFVHLIERVQESDSGSYLCQANNTMQSSEGSEVVGTGTCRMKVTVLVPPEPEMSGTLSCLEGNNVGLSLPVASVPPPHLYRWRKAGDETDYLQTSSPPFISNINRSFSGDYIVKVYNVLESTNDGTRYGEGLQFIRLHVQYPPEVSCEEEQNVLKGGEVILRCQVDSFPLPTVQWYRSGERLSNSSTLVLVNIAETDADFYICTASNTLIVTGKSRLVTGTCSTRVNVMYPPQPLVVSTKSVIEGYYANISLSMGSNPIPHIYELKKQNDNGTCKASALSPLISVVNRSDAGYYIVKARNRMNLTEAGVNEGLGIHLLELRVLYPVKTTCLTVKYVLLNTSVNITCDVEALPAPDNITWTHLSTTFLGPHLLIENVQVSDNGVYTCTARNTMIDDRGFRRHSSSTCNTTLTVLYPSPA